MISKKYAVLPIVACGLSFSGCSTKSSSSSGATIQILTQFETFLATGYLPGTAVNASFIGTSTAGLFCTYQTVTSTYEYVFSDCVQASGTSESPAGFICEVESGDSNCEPGTAIDCAIYNIATGVPIVEETATCSAAP